MEILSKNLKKIVDIETGGNIHRFSNDYLGEERSDKLRAWIKGGKSPNLAELDKLVQKMKDVLGKELNLNWLIYDKGQMYVDYEGIIHENESIKEELESLKEEYSKFKKMALSNFNFGGQFSQLVENIDIIKLLNLPFNKGLFSNA